MKFPLNNPLNRIKGNKNRIERKGIEEVTLKSYKKM